MKISINYIGYKHFIAALWVKYWRAGVFSSLEARKSETLNKALLRALGFGVDK